MNKFINKKLINGLVLANILCGGVVLASPILDSWVDVSFTRVAGDTGGPVLDLTVTAAEIKAPQLNDAGNPQVRGIYQGSSETIITNNSTSGARITFTPGTVTTNLQAPTTFVNDGTFGAEYSKLTPPKEKNIANIRYQISYVPKPEYNSPPEYMNFAIKTNTLNEITALCNGRWGVSNLPNSKFNRTISAKGNLKLPVLARVRMSEAETTEEVQISATLGIIAEGN